MKKIKPEIPMPDSVMRQTRLEQKPERQGESEFLE